MRIGQLKKYTKSDFEVLAIVDLKLKRVAYLNWAEFYYLSNLNIYEESRGSKTRHIIFTDYLQFPEL